MAAVTAGPAAEMANAAPGEGASSSIVAIPPNSHSSMPTIWIRLRIATSACPSSCRITQKKNRSALAVASANDLLSCPGTRPCTGPRATR